MTQPALATTDKKSGARYYKNPITGKRLPSVTTIMSAKAKPALIWWSAGMAAEWALDNPGIFPAEVSDWTEETREAAYQNMRRAHTVYKQKKADIGDEIHLLVEALATKQVLPDLSDEARPYLRPILEWVTEQQPDYLGSEVTVWNEEQEFAGTLDSYMGLGAIDPKTGKRPVWLMDTKTGNEVWPETAIQLAALGNEGNRVLHSNGYQEPTPDVAHYGIMHIIPDVYDEDGEIETPGAVVLHTMDPYIDAAWQAFVGCRALHRFGLLETKIKKEIQGK